MQIRSNNDQFEIHRFNHNGSAGKRLLAIDQGAPEDSVVVDSTGHFGLGMGGIATITAPLDVNGNTIRLRDIGGAAPGPLDGDDGDIRLVDDGDDHRIYVKFAGGWKSAVLT